MKTQEEKWWPDLLCVVSAVVEVHPILHRQDAEFAEVRREGF
jgi:hypothetical protein